MGIPLSQSTRAAVLEVLDRRPELHADDEETILAVVMEPRKVCAAGAKPQQKP
jgi:hypothetical protein